VELVGDDGAASAGASVDKLAWRSDNLRMSLDLNELLGDWPHEPGMIQVRKIQGRDGREKLQLRIDLGLIQMEVEGRPDGHQPHGCESLFEYQRGRAEAASVKGEPFSLSAEEVSDLQQEGLQYYHRYISLFQLEDYREVVRDTQRNLEMFAFVGEHAPDDDLAWSVEQFTPYVRMMNARAKASLALQRGDVVEAARLVEKGITKIRAFYSEAELDGELDAESHELGFLSEWLRELRGQQPLSELQKMQFEMNQAIASEAYERAAQLRDAIRAFQKPS